jgi:cation diffusion facilitator family transporter
MAETKSREANESLTSIVVALAANLTIAVAKGVAAVLTASPSLLAETLHTLADAGNEVLLGIAVRRGHRPASRTHPLGYGAELYYWALLAAIGMFVVGGLVSIWRGVEALRHPESLEYFWVGAGVLVLALTLDGTSRIVASRRLKAQAERRGLTTRQMIAESADPTLITVYAEDSIDVLGAALALVALIAHKVTGSPTPDAIATILIGLLLGVVAWRLADRNRELLTHQAVPERYQDQLRERLLQAPEVASIEDLIAVYMGPGEVLVAADVRLVQCDPASTLARLRAEVQDETPAIRRLYLTPV